jgi:stage II sporulation protein D
VLTRGVSPRILTARVMGSRGGTVVSGPELAGRLGLNSTWAHFFIRNGTSVTPEPDHSGQPSSTGTAPAPTNAVSEQGGVAPLETQSSVSLSASGGTPAA